MKRRLRCNCYGLLCPKLDLPHQPTHRGRSGGDENMSAANSAGLIVIGFPPPASISTKQPISKNDIMTISNGLTFILPLE